MAPLPRVCCKRSLKGSLSVIPLLILTKPIAPPTLRRCRIGNDGYARSEFHGFAVARPAPAAGDAERRQSDAGSHPARHHAADPEQGPGAAAAAAWRSLAGARRSNHAADAKRLRDVDAVA